MIIIGCASPGFGDVWANVCYGIDNSDKEILISNHTWDFQKKQYQEVLPLLNVPPKTFKWVDEPASYNYYAVQHYQKPFHPTKLLWTDKQFIQRRKSLKKPIIAYQFESQNKTFLPAKFFQKNEQINLKKLMFLKLNMKYDLRPIGLPLTAEESIKIACQASLFIGICSGQSNVLQSTRTPLLLRNWDNNMLGYYHPNKVYESFYTVKEMEEKIDWMLSPEYQWKYK